MVIQLEASGCGSTAELETFRGADQVRGHLNLRDVIVKRRNDVILKRRNYGILERRNDVILERRNDVILE